MPTVPCHALRVPWSRPHLPGGDGGGATPDPIPNSVVKPSSADGTAQATVWESRTPPGLFFFPSRSVCRFPRRTERFFLPRVSPRPCRRLVLPCSGMPPRPRGPRPFDCTGLPVLLEPVRQDFWLFCKETRGRQGMSAQEY